MNWNLHNDFGNLFDLFAICIHLADIFDDVCFQRKLKRKDSQQSCFRWVNEKYVNGIENNSISC